MNVQPESILMANLRGTGNLWSTTAVVNGDVSNAGSVGPQPYVAVFVKNTGANAVTLRLECAGVTGGSAGRNADLTNLDWFDYVSRGDPAPEEWIVAAGAFFCIDVSPFAPPYLRLKVVANTGGSTLTASFVSNG